MRISILFAGALLCAGLTAACVPIQAPSGTAPAAPAAPATATTIVLPDGTVCLWAGEGATLAFDGQRVNYTCGEDGTLALLGDLTQESGGVWNVTLATISHGADGFTLDAAEDLRVFAPRLDLADGAVCLHAGFGATIGYDDKRLNYTCEDAALGSNKQGQSDQGIVGVFGELTPDDAAPGVWLAEKSVLAGEGDSRSVASSANVPVVQITLDAMP